jgi:hypothetical protein
MKGNVQQQPNDPDWARLLDAEQRLEAEIAAAQADAQERLARARAAAAAPDPDTLAALAAEQEAADIERHRGELARISDQAETHERALAEAPDSLIDVLAQLALGAALTDRLVAVQR